jgi:hypothetical protein
MAKENCKNLFNNFVNFLTECKAQWEEKYEVVSRSYREEFEKEVNRKLKDGWRLVGGLAVDRDGFCQAMTKIVAETRA